MCRVQRPADFPQLAVDAMTDIDDEAERLVDAALNGDARAIKQVAEALDDASDEESTGEEDEFVKPVTQPGYGHSNI